MTDVNKEIEEFEEVEEDYFYEELDYGSDDGGDDYVLDRTEESERNLRMVDRVFEGATLVDGSKVTVVHSKGQDYVVYSVNNSSFVSWAWNFYDENVSEALLELGVLINKGRRKFKDVTKDRVNYVLAGTVRVIFESRKPEQMRKALEVFAEAIEQEPGVKHVISRNGKHSVWIGEKGSCGYVYRELNNVRESEDEFGRVQALAKAMLPIEHNEKIQHRIAVAMSIALRRDNGVEGAKIFEPVESLIYRLAENKLKIRYIYATTVSAVVLTALVCFMYWLAPLPEVLRASLVMVGSGFVGTLISVLERSKELRISEYESTELIVLQGVFRVGLGGAFGFIAYLAATSGLAFSLFKDTVPMLMLLGVAVGFSERLIPDLIQGMTTNKDV